MKSVKRFKKLLTMVLVFTVFITQFTPMSTLASEKLNTKDKYTITTPYEYPIKPGTAEWEKLKTHEEKIKVCQIPDDILKKMNTDTLVETVMNYPLMSDMFAMNTINAGYDAVYHQFNGLRELVARSDSINVLKNYNEKLPAFYTESSISSKQILKPIYKEVFIKKMNNNKEINLSNVISSREDKAVTLYTPAPNNTPYTAYYNQTWSDMGLTEEQVQATEEQYSRNYSATRLRNYSVKYNCHSYAWIDTSSSNLYWLDTPIVFMADRTYIQNLSLPTAGNIVFYDSDYGSESDHSGIVYSFSGGYGGGVMVISKWGSAGLYLHSLYDCPYNNDLSECTFWKRNNTY